MSDALEPWEPEETIGKIWHRWASHFDAPEPTYPQAAVHLEDETARLSVLFRGLGGDASVENPSRCGRGQPPSPQLAAQAGHLG